jgi:hypothetical protein
MKDWEATKQEVLNTGKYLGVIEFKTEGKKFLSYGEENEKTGLIDEYIQTREGEFKYFETILVTGKIIFGSYTNTCFLESGYILIEEGETIDEALSEMLQDLETFYRDGKEYVSRIVCNERM